jgi:hypothetical protein
MFGKHGGALFLSTGFVYLDVAAGELFGMVEWPVLDLLSIVEVS